MSKEEDIIEEDEVEEAEDIEIGEIRSDSIQFLLKFLKKEIEGEETISFCINQEEGVMVYLYTNDMDKANRLISFIEIFNNGMEDE